jgi:flagellar assembly protein FliH
MHTPAVRNFQYPSPPGDLSEAAVAEGNPRALQQNMARELEKARMEGLREGEGRAQRGFEQAINKEREAIASALRDFALERELYIARVEAEVVQLSLAIARKILHREAQLDPLILAGLVRVALSNLNDSSEVQVRVHPSQAQAWRELLARRKDASCSPEIVEDPAIQPTECTLLTKMGCTDLGLETQLKEIETGLFDLLAQRPRTIE